MTAPTTQHGRPGSPGDGVPTAPSTAPNQASGTKLCPQHLRGATRWVLVGALVLGFVLALAGIHNMNAAVTLLAALAIAVLHATLAALVVGLSLEAAHPDGTELGRPHHVVMIVGLILIGAATYLVDFRLLPTLELTGATGTVYLWLALGSMLVGAVVTYLVFSPKRLTGRPEQVGVWSLAACGGLLLGVGSALLLVIAPALYRDWRRPHEKLDLTVEGYTGGYVALGDSYSAGEGLRPFNPSTASGPDEDDCHRSARAYSQLLRFVDGTPPMRFVACASAVTPDMMSGFERDSVEVLPQLDGEEHPDVDLVTITIGGNDVVFSRVVKHCLLETTCLDKWFVPPSGGRVELPEADELGPWARTAIGMLSKNVSSVYAELRDDFPGARILVLGYPHLFPADEPTFWPDCMSILRRVSHDERQEIRGLTDMLNATLYARAVQAGIEFVSPAAAWDGHEPCGAASQYTNAIKPILDLSVVDGGSFHPNSDGQRRLAALVACYLRTYPTAPSAYADPGAGADGLAVDGAVGSLADLGLVDPPGSLDHGLDC